jgi:hypothetical protein
MMAREREQLRPLGCVELAEVVEDAVIAALEEGAAPPNMFDVHLPRAAFADARDDGLVINAAGFWVRLLVEGEVKPWVH